VKIHTLDLRFQGAKQAIASYLLEGPDGLVLIETGPGSTLAALRSGVAAHGFDEADVRHVLLTHIHLDHAGAAGWWATQGATVYVHHFGAPHLIDPSKLMASATRIYGERMDTLWGTMIPAPPDRVVALRDGDELAIAGLRLTAVETPGHARHHHLFRLGDVAFAGDIAGIRLPGCTFIDVPAPPPEFDREDWFESIRTVKEMHLERLFLTHYGEVSDVTAHLERVEVLVEEGTEWIRSRSEAGVEREDLVAEYEARTRARAAAEGVDGETMSRYELANPLYMSVDGILRYWKRRVTA
jgi:glyoxylase-like metal-dependent hydrolase (beta-lactamase superfamily II)